MSRCIAQLSYGKIKLVIRNPTTDKPLRLIRIPRRLFLHRFEGQELINLEYGEVQLQIEKWGGGELPRQNVKLAESGWLTLQFTCDDAVRSLRLFPKNGEYELSGTLIFAHLPMVSVIGGNESKPEFMLPIKFTIGRTPTK